MIIIWYTVCVHKCSCNGAADDFTTSYCWQFKCALLLLRKPSSKLLHLLAQLAVYDLWHGPEDAFTLYMTVLSVSVGKWRRRAPIPTAGTLNATNWKRALHVMESMMAMFHQRNRSNTTFLEEQLRWDCCLDISRTKNTHTNKANVFGINFLLCQFTIV